MGIYFHIPFCKQACNYCDFHFSTSLKYKQDVINAMLLELEQRKNEFAQQTIDTIYFGGGTPSTLTAKEVQYFIDKVAEFTTIATDCEITLEANPDDLTKTYLKELKQTPINRFSIGTQSFFNADLEYMNRAHNAEEAIASIKTAQDLGFEQMNIDLIYGSPTTTNEMWQQNLEQWKQLNVPHLSAYCLTVEENTALYADILNKKSVLPSEEQASEQFEMLLNFVAQNNINHYEISNFCTGENYAKHNTSYWFGKAYVGIGPSAHSFNGDNVRRWNIANNVKYVKGVNLQDDYFGTESLTLNERINEHVLTRLRTKWGLNKFEIEDKFGQAIWDVIDDYTLANKQHFHINSFGVSLNREGMFLADKISSDLFV